MMQITGVEVIQIYKLLKVVRTAPRVSNK